MDSDEFASRGRAEGQAVVKPTDVLNPEYFHKVVDCQWACPAHTPVPEYIRKIAAGDYNAAYMINWKSNVFPGILGRSCDRPCEPACRRGRLEEQPVAICRLKRVAADHKQDIAALLPGAPLKRNGKRVACVGAGPASLTVARDLAAIGYEVVAFDSDSRAGGMMRSQIPKFRLPDEVIDEEVGYALSTGGQFVAERRIDSLKGLAGEGYDAIFVGCGAPRGRNLEIPGRREAPGHIHIGIDWLASVSFGHVSSIGRRVVVLGGGNTAMDCCRTARRLGGAEVKVVVRSGFAEMKASPWEKEDAMREGVEILNFLAPKAFTHDAGRLTGVVFEKMAAKKDERGRRVLMATGDPDVLIECDDVLIAVGQENAFPWIESDAGVAFDRNGLPAIDAVTFQSSLPNVFFGGDSAFGPKNIITAVAHGHEAAISIDAFCSGEDPRLRPPPMTNLMSQKMGIHEWSYDNAITIDGRFKVPHRQRDRPQEYRHRSRVGLRPRARAGGGATLPQLRRADRILRAGLHRVRRLRRYLSGRLHFLRRQRSRGAATAIAQCASRRSFPGALRFAPGEDRSRHGQRRGPLPALRPLRGTLSDRGVGHAEVYDRDGTSGVGMLIHAINDFVIRFANVNGSGSASANLLFARSILRMGVPIAPRNIFPSNIQGLPTWYEVRVSERGWLGALGRTDVMVAMNPQTFDKDVASIEPGGYLFYDSSRSGVASRLRSDIVTLGMPLTEICAREYADLRQRQLFKNIVYVGALAALLDIEIGVVESLIADQFKGKAKLVEPNIRALHIGFEDARSRFRS